MRPDANYAGLDKSKLIKILKISSIIFPILFIFVALFVLPNIKRFNNEEIYLFQIILFFISVLDFIGLRLVAKMIERKQNNS